MPFVSAVNTVVPSLFLTYLVTFLKMIPASTEQDFHFSFFSSILFAPDVQNTFGNHFGNRWGKRQKSKGFRRSGDHNLYFIKFLYKVKTQQNFRERVEGTASHDVIRWSSSGMCSLPRVIGWLLKINISFFSDYNNNVGLYGENSKAKKRIKKNLKLKNLSDYSKIMSPGFQNIFRPVAE